MQDNVRLSNARSGQARKINANARREERIETIDETEKRREKREDRKERREK